MVSGEVGEITSFPTGRHRLGAGTVMLAGLGTIDTYSDNSLELVGESIMRTVLLTRLSDFAIVPLGAASGGNVDMAFEKLLSGFLRALSTVPDGRLRGFSICELDPARFNELRQTLYRLLRSNIFGQVEITINEQRLPLPPVTRAALRAGFPETVYLLVREEPTEPGTANVAASVLTPGGKAAIVQGRRRVEDRDIDDIAKKLAESGIPNDRIAEFGKRLVTRILPDEVSDLLAQELKITDASPSRPLVVVHDASMSRIPWETIQIGGAAPALRGGLTHRYDGGVISVAKCVAGRDARRRSNRRTGSGSQDRLRRLGELFALWPARIQIGTEPHRVAVGFGCDPKAQARLRRDIACPSALSLCGAQALF
jgi:hypothetical protein